jgi:hypothetical protein
VPIFRLSIGLILGDAIAFLNSCDQAILFAGDDLPVAVGELPPLLTSRTRTLLPFALDLVSAQVFSPRWASAPYHCHRFTLRRAPRPTVPLGQPTKGPPAPLTAGSGGWRCRPYGPLRAPVRYSTRAPFL